MNGAVDTSVAIAAFSTWHRFHEAALRIVNLDVRLPAHAGFETYSVLTRLPRPHRADPKRVVAFLEATFPGDWLTLPGPMVAGVVRELAELGITGGATYDGLIGAIARLAGVKLYTCDRRALPVYSRLGVETELVG